MASVSLFALACVSGAVAVVYGIALRALRGDKQSHARGWKEGEGRGGNVEGGPSIVTLVWRGALLGFLVGWGLEPWSGIKYCCVIVLGLLCGCAPRRRGVSDTCKASGLFIITH